MTTTTTTTNEKPAATHLQKALPPSGTATTLDMPDDEPLLAVPPPTMTTTPTTTTTATATTMMASSGAIENNNNNNKLQGRLLAGVDAFTPPPGSPRSCATVDLAFHDVCVSVDKVPLLANIRGFVRPGEILAVMGPSGAGKTTLLNVLSGRLKPDSGCVSFNGEDLQKRHKRKTCYVLQHDVFFQNLTLRQTLLG
ncbi:unnamed protein product [Notodromas monacha]|uniref:ABC transporter domain-containing protein n=1 Tax=Notodromas monacha TaxID=399045 RepID=A0A7R9BXP6_9CRUS|nr:unnamed protein product [Notodromas monacha]CAG0922321.1 unnamed protein product [Notodromas monacha]